ncbi:MAG: aspartyl protease family protein [Candidatus Bathyarchaeia archaeon]
MAEAWTNQRFMEKSYLKVSRREGWRSAMGYVKVLGVLSDPAKRKSVEVEFLSDTGAGYMVVPPSLAEEIGLLPVEKMKVTLADRREVEALYSFAYVKVLGREAPVPVLIMDTPMPLIGSFTLQVLGLLVDPVKEEVRPSRPFAVGLLSTN